MSGGKFGNEKFDVNPEFSKSETAACYALLRRNMMDTYDTVKELEIISYQDNGDYHVCKDEEARKKVNIDLLTDGTIPIPEGRDYIEFCKSLVGKRVRIDYSHTYLHMASNPKILGA